MILIFTFSESEVLLYWVSPGNLYASVVVTFFFFRKQIFTYDLEVSEKKKSLDKLGSLKKTLNMWFQRDLSIVGRINIIKTLALSKLVFICSVMNTPLKT